MGNFKCLQIEADLSFSMAVGGRILKNASDIGFSWHFVHTKTVLSDNIDSREAFAQALMLSLDEDPDTSNVLGQSWGQFSANLQENCEVSIQHILEELC